jgi:catechol 2,3-dioxygenase-like lactoylglutathione lyase family enzyme
MSTVQASGESATGSATVKAVEMRLEVVVVPVSDVDRAKEFYERLGWRLDADIARGDDFRLVEFTPPGSGCSIQFGTNLTSAAPGSAESLYLIVADIDAAREELLVRGVAVSEVFHEGTPGARFHDSGHLRLLRGLRRSGRQRLAAAGDHDAAAGPLRGCAMATTYESVKDLADALRRAAEAHGKHEERIGEADPNWPDWYALYMVREHAGEELPA